MGRKRGAPTMRDVALLAGVSVQTVSYVVNSSPVITAETRLRVQQAIEQLDYHLDATAQSLRSGKSKVIGLLIPDFDNPHHIQIIKGVQEVLNAHDYTLVLSTTEFKPERERKILTALSHQTLAGLIVTMSSVELSRHELDRLQRMGKPIVSIYPWGQTMDTVVGRWDKGAEQMMDYLTSLGHKRIGLIHGVFQPFLGMERIEAYQKYLDKAGIPYDERLVVHCGSSYQCGFEATEELLAIKPRPTAILGINDVMAFAAIQAILRKGLRVPEDISVAGFDDIELSSLVTPALTTVRVDGFEIGRQLAQLLFARLADPDLPLQREELPVELIVRNSTGPCNEA